MSKTNLKLLIESIVKEEKIKFLLESQLSLGDDPATKTIYEKWKDSPELEHLDDLDSIVKIIKSNIGRLFDVPQTTFEEILAFLNPDPEKREKREKLEKAIKSAAFAIMLKNADPNATINEAKYKGRTVTLNKPFLTPDGPKKRAVYVKNPKTGNVKKVNFGDPNMRIKKSNPKRRKSFRARHKCSQKKDRTTAGFWSCKFWE